MNAAPVITSHEDNLSLNFSNSVRVASIELLVVAGQITGERQAMTDGSVVVR